MPVTTPLQKIALLQWGMRRKTWHSQETCYKSINHLFVMNSRICLDLKHLMRDGKFILVCEIKMIIAKEYQSCCRTSACLHITRIHKSRTLNAQDLHVAESWSLQSSACDTCAKQLCHNLELWSTLVKHFLSRTKYLSINMLLGIKTLVSAWFVQYVTQIL